MPEARAELLKPAICNETMRVCTRRFGKALRAIVLTGSLARDEATVFGEGACQKLLGDADFYLVIHDRAEEPGRPALTVASDEIQTGLRGMGLAGRIGLSAVGAKYLTAMPHHILTYELRAHGVVVWGDQQVLLLVPAFAAEEISREDAWRLLANRIVEQLGTITSVGEHDTPETQYNTVKLYLDMATSFLVFARRYQSTYRGREIRLQELAGMTAALPLRALADHVSACTRFKLDGKVLSHDRWTELRKDCFKLAGQLWSWELAELTGEAGEWSATDLMSRWMASQPLKVKLRGWGSVIRRSGWLRSRREWLRWLRLVPKASPRYLVYSVAAELFFSSGTSAGDPEQAEALAHRLPSLSSTAPSGAAEALHWLARLTTMNYREFVETTTA